MIALSDPLSPHESTSKHGAMAARLLQADESDASSAPDAKHERELEDEDDDDASGTEASDDEVARQSADELKLLTLDSLPTEPTSPPAAQDGAKEPTTSDAPTATAAAAPVKRILRRKRKRMSEDERRIRHREVQRQFMKRKRARLGEMRKFLRGLESQHRLVQIMNERATLEKENAELKERLANPGPGWQWDDATTTPTKDQEPHVVHLVPEHGFMAFHPGQPMPMHHAETLPHQYQLPHLYPPQYILHQSGHHHARHAVIHRAPVPGAPMPWDDILDAVTAETMASAFHDISF